MSMEAGYEGKHRWDGMRPSDRRFWVLKAPGRRAGLRGVWYRLQGRGSDREASSTRGGDGR